MLRGSWPAPTPRPVHAKDTVQTRQKEEHGYAVSTEGWDELFTLQPVASGAGYGTGKRCLGITGRTTQPRSGWKSEKAAPQLLAGVRGPSQCPDTWPCSAHRVGMGCPCGEEPKCCPGASIPGTPRGCGYQRREPAAAKAKALRPPRRRELGSGVSLAASQPTPGSLPARAAGGRVCDAGQRGCELRGRLPPATSTFRDLRRHQSSTQYCYCAKWELYSLLWVLFLFFFFFFAIFFQIG